MSWSQVLDDRLFDNWMRGKTVAYHHNVPRHDLAYWETRDDATVPAIFFTDGTAIAFVAIKSGENTTIVAFARLPGEEQE